MSGTDSREEKRYQGLGVSPGIARGTVFVYRTEDEEAPARRISEEEIEPEPHDGERQSVFEEHQIMDSQEARNEKQGD